MRKTRVLLFLLFLLGTGLFAQTDNNSATLTGNEFLLNNIVQLKEQAKNVNAAYDKLRASATGSRSTYAVAIATLNDACNNYLAELKKQQALTTVGSEINEAIVRETAAVKKLQSDFCPAAK